MPKSSSERELATPPSPPRPPEPPGPPAPPDSGRLAPHPVLDRYYADEAGRRRFVADIFDGTAEHYERILGLMSPFGEGDRYRRRALSLAGLAPGMRSLDVASGTGAVTRQARRLVGDAGRVVALDPSIGMLLHQRRRDGARPMVRALGEALPLRDAAMDFLSMGFALRHLSDLRGALAEYRRVLRPGGRLLLLEMSTPRSRLGRAALRFYLGVAVPALARLGTGSRDAQQLMEYYWETVDQCVAPEVILEALAAAGFTQVDRRMELGFLSAYLAIKAGD